MKPGCSDRCCSARGVLRRSFGLPISDVVRYLSHCLGVYTVSTWSTIGFWFELFVSLWLCSCNIIGITNHFGKTRPLSQLTTFSIIKLICHCLHKINAFLVFSQSSFISIDFCTLLPVHNNFLKVTIIWLLCTAILNMKWTKIT